MAVYRFIEPRLGRRRLREWRMRAFRLLAFLALIIALCAIGLALLDNSAEPDAHKLLLGVWNAVNLVTTLGDFTGFDLRQKLFMLGAMLCVMILGAYAIGELTGILSSAEVVAYRENRRMERTLKDLSGHSIVLGFVGAGRMLAAQLREAGHTVVVIDRDPGNAAEASDLGYLAVQGDAGVNDGVLHNARIGTARALFVTTADVHRNLSLTLMAHTLNAKLRIIVTAPDERWGEMLRRAGASEVVIADRVLAQAMLSRLDGPGAHAC
jgi:voltage-gated potassium channel Kch